MENKIEKNIHGEDCVIEAFSGRSLIKCCVAVSYPDTQHLIKGSTVKQALTPVLLLPCVRQRL